MMSKVSVRKTIRFIHRTQGLMVEANDFCLMNNSINY